MASALSNRIKRLEHSFNLKSGLEALSDEELQAMAIEARQRLIDSGVTEEELREDELAHGFDVNKLLGW